MSSFLRFETINDNLHVARAFYAAAATLQKESDNVDAGIALPYTQAHRDLIKNIQSSLKLLGIAVFWVKSNGDIDAENWNS